MSYHIDVSSHGTQFIFRNEPGDIYLAAVSKFILNAYEFGDATAPEPVEPVDINGSAETASAARERSNSVAGPHNQPYLSKCRIYIVPM